MNKPRIINSFKEVNLELQKIGDAQSIAGGVEKMKDKYSGEIFYKKLDKDREEFEKLYIMYCHDIKSPISTFFNISTGELLTSGTGGIVLSEYMRTPQGTLELPRIINEVIEEISKIWNRMKYTPEEITKRDPSHTKHPIQNFESRFIKQKSSASSAFLNATSNDIENLNMSKKEKLKFSELYSHIQEVIENYLSKILDIGDDHLEDDEVCFGDAKPENIVIDPIRKSLYLIDPSFIRGSKYFDLSKMISRLIIEGIDPRFAIHETLRRSGNFDIKKPVYRGLSIADLVNIDMANILSSYLGRAFQGNSKYRMVQKLSSENFLDNLKKGLEEIEYKNPWGEKYK